GGPGHGELLPARTQCRGSPPLRLPHIIAERVLKLCRPDGGGVPMVPLVDDRAVVGVTDPHGFAGAEAGGGREAHRVGCV
ncbi:MAG: hypothetical protein ACK559_22340, partial [bacterium]